MRYALFFVTALLMFSCKKDGDTSAPTVNILLPVDGLQADVLDTIHVKVQLSDDAALSRVEVRLVTTAQTPVMIADVRNVSGTEATVEFDYILYDTHVLSGQYYIEAKAFDEAGNEAHDFALINLTEVPRVLKGVFAATTTPGFVALHCIDSAWNLSAIGSYQGDFTDLEVNNWWQQVGYTGYETGVFRSITIDGAWPGWTMNALPSAGPYWGNVISEGKDWLVNFRANGLLKTYTWNGSSSVIYTANSAFHFRYFVRSGDKLFADMADFSETARLMGVYVSDGGGAIQQTTMNLDPVALLPRDATSIYAVGNENNQGKLLIYDYDQNGFWEPVALPAGKVLSAVEIDASTLLIAMDNGTVYKFTYSPVGLLPWLSATVQHIRYDNAGGTVITCEGTSVKQYDYPLTNVIDQVMLADTASDIELWYNR